MIKNYYKSFGIFLISTILLPVISFAAIVPDCVTGASNGVDCGFNDLTQLINKGLTWFLTMAAVIAAITCVAAGGKILSNPGNPAKRSEALTMFKKALIGLAIVLLAWAVIKMAIGAIVDPATGALRFFTN